MNDTDIWDHIFRTLREDRDYQEALENLRYWEPDYLAVLESLTDVQRDQIEKYISACEAQNDSMILHAYRLGYEKGRLDPFLVNP